MLKITLVAVKAHTPLLTAMFCIFQFSNCFANSQDGKNCPVSPQSPNITILSDSEGFRAGDGRILASQPLQLQCTASYPIYWQFTPNKGSKYNIMSKANENCFSETLIVNASHSKVFGRTGNYTCISGTDSNIVSWIYLHIRDNKEMFHRVHHDYADTVKGEEEFWSIPCTANLNQFEEIKLFNHTPKAIGESDADIPNYDTSSGGEVSFNSEEDSYLESSESGPSSTSTTTVKPPTEVTFAKYDAKFGFLLRKSNFSRPHGKFECRGIFKNVSDSFALTLKNYRAIPSEEHVVYTRNNKIELLCESDEDIEIDLSKSNLLKTISSIKHSTPAFKYSLKVVLEEQSNISSQSSRFTPSKNTSGLISCISAYSKKVFHTWKHDHKETTKCHFHRSSLGDSVFSGEGSKFSRRLQRDVGEYPYVAVEGRESSRRVPGTAVKKYDYFKGSCNTLAGQKANCYYSDSDTQAVTSIMEHNFDKLSHSDVHKFHHSEVTNNTKNYTTTIIKCESQSSNGGGYKTIIKIVPTLSGFVVNPTLKHLHHNDSLKIFIRENEKINYLAGDVVEIWCVASKYIFSDSIQWFLHYKNGSSSLLPERSDVLTAERNESFAKIPREWAYVKNVLVEMEEHLHSITCKARIWNSTDVVTENLSFQINNPWVITEPYKAFDSNNIVDTCNSRTTNPVILMKREMENGLTSRLKMHNVTDLNIKISQLWKTELVCVAEYQTTWTLRLGEGYLPPSQTKVQINSLSNGTSTDKYSMCFENTVTPHVTSKSEYFCEKVGDSSKFSSVRIFSHSTSDPTPGFQVDQHLYPGSHIEIIIDEDMPETIFPCRVNDPKIIPDLYYHESPGVYQKLAKPAFMSYDRKHGFHMNTTLLTISTVKGVYEKLSKPVLSHDKGSHFQMHHSMVTKSTLYVCSLNNPPYAEQTITIKAVLFVNNKNVTEVNAKNVTEVNAKNVTEANAKNDIEGNIKNVTEPEWDVTLQTNKLDKIANNLDKNRLEVFYFQGTTIFLLVLIIVLVIWLHKRRQTKTLEITPRFRDRESYNIPLSSRF